MRKNMKKKQFSRTNLLYCLEFNFTDGATFFCSSIKFMGKEKWIHENSSWCHINHVTKCFVIFAIILSRCLDLKKQRNIYANDLLCAQEILRARPEHEFLQFTSKWKIQRYGTPNWWNLRLLEVQIPCSNM